MAAVTTILGTAATLAANTVFPGGGLRLDAPTVARLATASLKLESEPPGALAHLDGREIGLTPLTLASVPAGPHRLRLSVDNYHDWSGEIVVSAGVSIDEHIGLSPLPALLQVETTLRGAHLWVDDAPSTDLPGSAELPPGARFLRIEADGYRKWEGPISLAPNERRSLYVLPAGSDLSLTDDDPSQGIAVMIDNLAAARPQVGLDLADVVYEALAEGGITRFLAFFLTQDADLIGPVRSTRHYFVQWATEYSAPLVHIGASPQGYAALATSRNPTVDGGRATWRMTGRPAPHNAFTSTVAAKGFLRSRQPGNFGGLRFRVEPGITDGPPADGIRIAYRPSGYTVEWVYDSSLKRYLRSMDGKPHLDGATGNQLSATNVIVLWMNSFPIPDDDANRLDFALVGNGRFVALFHGVAIEGRWRKNSLRGVTEYLDAGGEPVLLNEGATWIQVVPSVARVALLEPPGGTDSA